MMNPIATNVVFKMKRGQELQLDQFGGFYTGDLNCYLPIDQWLAMTVVHLDGRESRVLARRYQRGDEPRLYEVELKYDYTIRLWVTPRGRA